MAIEPLGEQSLKLGAGVMDCSNDDTIILLLYLDSKEWILFSFLLYLDSEEWSWNGTWTLMVNQKCVGIPAFQGKMSESYQSMLATWDLGIMMERKNLGL